MGINKNVKGILGKREKNQEFQSFSQNENAGHVETLHVACRSVCA